MTNKKTIEHLLAEQFVERIEMKVLERLEGDTPSSPFLNNRDGENQVKNIVFKPIITDYVEELFMSLFYASHQNPDFPSSRLDRIWLKYKTKRCAQEFGMNAQEAGRLVDAAKEVILEELVHTAPIKLECDVSGHEQVYELRKTSEGLYVQHENTILFR